MAGTVACATIRGTPSTRCRATPAKVYVDGQMAVDLPTRHADEVLADRPPSAANRGRSTTVNAGDRGRSAIVNAGYGASSTAGTGVVNGGRAAAVRAAP
jgi:hypothetical protein